VRFTRFTTGKEQIDKNISLKLAITTRHSLDMPVDQRLKRGLAQLRKTPFAHRGPHDNPCGVGTHHADRSCQVSTMPR
jgi:hypothetical protein